MKIFIPTRGRLKNQLTLSNLPRDLKARTIVVAPKSECFWHKTNHEMSGVTVWEQPDPDMGIAAKREWIMKTANSCGVEKLVMLDDDLRFAVRREDDTAKFRKADDSDILDAFEELEHNLSEETPHAGFSARGSGIGDAAQRGGWQEAKRMMYVLGYHVPTVLAQAEFGRMKTHEDMDICLQLLTKGYPNKVNFSFVVDQKFGCPGGCDKERTLEINNADAFQLAAYFPGIVRATEKLYVGSPIRVEVVCAWMKALAEGRAKRGII